MKKISTTPLSGESYVLRLYRQGQDDCEGLPGILEEPISGQRWSFKSMDELKQLLNERLQDAVNET